MEFAQKVGEHEGLITAVMESLRRGETIFASMEKRLNEAQVDLEGTTEQLRNSLTVLKTLEQNFSQVKTDLDEVKEKRTSAWTTHDKSCQKCHDSLREVIKQEMEAYSTKIENMGVLALAKKYWWALILASLLLGDILDIMNIFQNAYFTKILHFVVSG